jgi:long-subunit fatty acid transport protein
MLSMGLMHRFNDSFSAVVSYSYGHYESARIDISMPGTGTLLGTYQRDSHALGVQTRIQF